MYKDMFTTLYTKNSKDTDGMFKELFSPVAFLPNCRIFTKFQDIRDLKIDNVTKFKQGKGTDHELQSGYPEKQN